MPRGGYAAFVERQRVGGADRAAAAIVDGDGQVLAAHDGVHRFTIGQRRGLGVAGGAPRYVTAIDGDGTVRLGGAAQVVAAGLVADAPNWLVSPPPVGARVAVKIRSRFAPQSARVVRGRRGWIRRGGRRGTAGGHARAGGGAVRRRSRAGRRLDPGGRAGRGGGGNPSRWSSILTPAAPRKLRVAFATLGCKVNQYDTATMQTALRRRLRDGAVRRGRRRLRGQLLHGHRSRRRREPAAGAAGATTEPFRTRHPHRLLRADQSATRRRCRRSTTSSASAGSRISCAPCTIRSRPTKGASLSATCARPRR